MQTTLEQDPFAWHVFVFRGRRGDLVKLLWWDGDGLCLFPKGLERGRFVWPKAESGVEKSNSLVVPVKLANKAVQTAAELVEGRSGTEENAEVQSTVRTQSRAGVSRRSIARPVAQTDWKSA